MHIHTATAGSGLVCHILHARTHVCSTAGICYELPCACQNTRCDPVLRCDTIDHRAAKKKKKRTKWGQAPPRAHAQACHFLFLQIGPAWFFRGFLSCEKWSHTMTHIVIVAHYRARVCARVCVQFPGSAQRTGISLFTCCVLFCF